VARADLPATPRVETVDVDTPPTLGLPLRPVELAGLESLEHCVGVAACAVRGLGCVVPDPG